MPCVNYLLTAGLLTAGAIPDASLPRGTSVEMILDWDLQFSPADLRF